MSSSMYTSPQSRATSAYQRAHVDTRIGFADQHQIVGLLYDGVLESITVARGAIQRGDVPAKCNAIAKAVRIIEEGLKAGLDLQAGGDLARNLEGLYGYCVVRLALANARNDEEVLEEVAALITELANAWKGIRESAIQPAHAPTGA